MNQVAEAKVRSRTTRARGRSSDETYTPIMNFNQLRSPVTLFRCRICSHIPVLQDLPPQRPLNTNWHEASLGRFFNDWIIRSNIPLGTFGFIQELFNQPNCRPYLKEAVEAVAFVNQSNQMNIAWLAVDGRRAYCNSIGLVQEALKDDVEARTDDCMATLILYGLLTSEAILLIYNHSINRATLRCLVTNKPPAKEAERWLHDIGLDDIANQLAKCNLKTVRLCADAQNLFNSKTQDEYWILGLLNVLKNAILVDIVCQDWSNSVSGIWRYRTMRTSSNPDLCAQCNGTAMEQRTDPTFVYHDIMAAGIWNNYRSARIHLHEVLLHCSALLELHPSAAALALDHGYTQSESHTIISKMISEICSSVSFCLGKIDSEGKPTTKENRKAVCGYLLIWPLFMAKNSCTTGSERFTWITDILREIATEGGLRGAFQLIDKPKKTNWDLG
ncbi:hypothetical protein B7463_g11370, partial [Scytalidium lignicola]